MKIINLKHKIPNQRKGFIFLEILIASGLVSSVLMALLSIGFLSLNVSSSVQKTTQADFLIKEELEAVRSFRDGTVWSINGLGVVQTGSSNPYYLVKDNSVNPPKWILNPGTETIGIFTRKVIFDKVSRDSNGDIVTYGSKIKGPFKINSAFAAACVWPPCTDDPDTKKVTVIITFENKTLQVVTYLTNWQK